MNVLVKNLFDITLFSSVAVSISLSDSSIGMEALTLTLGFKYCQKVFKVGFHFLSNLHIKFGSQVTSKASAYCGTYNACIMDTHFFLLTAQDVNLWWHTTLCCLSHKNCP